MSTIDIHLAQRQKPSIEREMPLFKDTIDADEQPRIKITYETITSESAEHGDVADSGWIDEEGEPMTPDEWDRERVPDVFPTAVEKAVAFLRDAGVGEASSSPWSPGTWYTHYGEMDTSGETENRSYHLEGFTEEQEQEIYAEIKRRWR